MNSFKKILPFFRKYRVQVVIAVIAIMAMSMTDLLVPRQVQVIIDQGIGQSSSAGVYQGNTSIIVTRTLLMVGLALLSMGLAFLNTFLSTRISEGFAADLRERIYASIQKFSFANLDQLQTGELLVRLTSDVTIIKNSVMMSLRILLRAPLLLVGSLVMLIITSPRLSLLLLVLIPIIFVLILVISRVVRPLFKEVQERLEKVNTVLQENIAGVRLVRAFVRSDHEQKRFARANEQLVDKQVKVYRLLSFLMPTMILILNLSIAALLWFGGNMVIVGTLTTGEIVAFSNYLLLTMFPIVLLAMILPQFYAASASIDRVMEVIETHTALVYPLEGDHRITAGRVTFENVCLDYDDSDCHHDPVLQDINFTAEPGQMVAILGATGSGKTSLVNLVPRLYDPTRGRVLIDGVDVREFTERELRSNIAVALQNAVLFSGTIAENISYGCPNATQEQIEAAARAANAHEFIMEREGGYDAPVSQRGSNFSGGQKQRLAIARALCIKPRILILDDSTSAVDVETEAEIQTALENLMEGRTSLVVAQRISTVLRADKIIVLENGRIVAEGNHHELIQSSPIYQSIYDSQLGDGLEKLRLLEDNEEVENAQ